MPWILDLALMMWFFKASGVKYIEAQHQSRENSVERCWKRFATCWKCAFILLKWQKHDAALKYDSNMLKSSLICRFPAQILTLDFLYCNVRPPLHSSRVSLRFAACLPAAPPTTSAFICCQFSVVFCCFLCSCLIQVTLTSERPHLAPAALCVHPVLVKCVKH